MGIEKKQLAQHEAKWIFELDTHTPSGLNENVTFNAFLSWVLFFLPFVYEERFLREDTILMHMEYLMCFYFIFIIFGLSCTSLGMWVRCCLN